MIASPKFSVNHAMGMVSLVGHSTDKWKFTGTLMIGEWRRWFQLVDVGNCLDLDSVRSELSKHGRVPEGQWVGAFMGAFPIGDGEGPIGVADPSWENFGDRMFPFIASGGLLNFTNADDFGPGYWRWLVEIPKQATKF